ncbi:MAG: SLBB domain-containing protein [candidate division Zixibacteria bacterium]|nr:SLBB domain-containing protein [candidate division Zixibacteria bacterium]
MKKIALMLIVAILSFFLLNFPLFAQSLEEKEKLYQEYLKKKVASEEGDIPKYQTPEIYEQTEPVVEKKKKSPVSVSSPVATVSPQIPKAGPDSLQPFGYDMFNVSPLSFAPLAPTSVPPDYTLGPGDNVIVNLWGKVDLELDLTVDREGKVFIPKAGDLTVWGLSLDQFEEKLTKKLSTIYSGFEMSVIMGKIRSIKVFVFGEVTNPGGYTISSLSTLFNALYIAGGPNQRGSMRKIKLNRNNREIAIVDLYDFLLKGYNKDNIKLASNDVIYVPVVGPLVKIRGEIKRPAIYELKGGETILDLINLAGALKPTAYLERVMVDRIAGQDHRVLLDVNLYNQSTLEKENLKLKDGDDVSIFSIFDLIENLVWIDGQVKHPGAFQRNPGMRVWDLIRGGEQLQKDAYLPRADLIRTYPDEKKQIIPLNLEKVLAKDSTDNIVLMDKDRLTVYGYWDVTRKKHVSIDGAVKKPGQYELYEKMKLSDLIFLAGNPLKNAYLLKGEIAHVNPGKPANITYINLKDLYTDSQDFIVKQNPGVDIFLKEDDQVFIREIPEWSLQKIVTLEGEVMFPGKYALEQEKETLYHLLQRAGGLTPKAFSKGVVFLRPSIIQDVERKNIQDVVTSTQLLERDTLGNMVPPSITPFNPAKLNRVIIDLPKILKEKGGESNIVLQDGDSIFVPQIPSEVQVVGSVGSSSSIKFAQGKKVKYYIDRVGGYTRNSDKKQTRLIRADGKVISGGSLRGRRVELGDVIVVPQKIEEKKNWMKFMANAAVVLSSVATTVFVIDRLQ